MLRLRHVHPEQFRIQRQRCALSRLQVSDTLGVTERTVRNWEAGRTRIPYAAFKLLRILAGYFLPGKAWRGFYLRGDTIWSPEGKSFQAADLAWWGLTVAMARSWRQSRERAQTAAQPVPPLGSALALPLPVLPPAEPGFTVRSDSGYALRRRPARGGARRCACGLCGVPSPRAEQGVAGGGARSGTTAA